MPWMSSTRSSFGSGSTNSRSFQSVSSPPTSEAPNSSPILKSGSSSLRASVSLPEPPTFEASSSSRVGSQETSKTHIRYIYPTRAVCPATSEVPNSSITLKSYTSSCLRTGSQVTPVKLRGSTTGSLPPIFEVPPTSSPIPSSSPVLRDSSPKASPLLTAMVNEGSPTVATRSGSHKRSHWYRLLSDDGLDDSEDLPTKKSKPLLTTCMLELSRISRRAFAAKMEYQRLRAEELELMASLLKDEMEEVHGHLTKTDLQIGSLRNDLHDAGVAVIGSRGRKDAKEIGNSQGSRSHGRGTTSGAQPTVDEYGVSITPFQPTPFQASENDSRVTTERRIAANTMIHTEGPPIDTLQQHQSRRRIGQLPAQECLRPYAIPSTRTPSQHMSSRASMSTILLDNLNDDGTRSQRSQLTEPTAGVIKLILDELSTVQGKLVQDAEGCLSALGLQHDNKMSEEDQMARILARANLILDEQNLQDYFLHGWDADREKILVFSAPAFLNFHETFWFGRSSPFLNDSTSRAQISKPSWFMYELSGAALYCVIRRAATGRLSKSQNILQFTTQEFQPVALGIWNAIK
ncbi:hypothetical protein C8R48DRAFT_672179 [Suillus tomentosus]|nr:hypothetical protein C8R48DRAFT_672179 [Suillus tomentosus]